MKEIEKNPYTVCGNRETKLSIVSFFDILGYRNYVRDDIEGVTVTQKLDLLRNSVEKSHKYITDNVIPESINAPRFWETKTFSDNVSVLYPVRHDKLKVPGYATCSDNTILALNHVVSITSFMQMEMIRTGNFFIRGAIGVGAAYADNNLIFSDALAIAYDDETHNAKNPRVILSESAVSCVENYLENDKYGDEYDFLDGIERDDDGYLFINYLKELQPEGDFERLGYLDIHRERILQKLELGVCLSKYQWTAKYHNQYCLAQGIKDKLIPEDKLLLGEEPAKP